IVQSNRELVGRRLGLVWGNTEYDGVGCRIANRGNVGDCSLHQRAGLGNAKSAASAQSEWPRRDIRVDGGLGIAAVLDVKSVDLSPVRVANPEGCPIGVQGKRPHIRLVWQLNRK